MFFPCTSFSGKLLESGVETIALPKAKYSPKFQP